MMTTSRPSFLRKRQSRFWTPDQVRGDSVCSRKSDKSLGNYYKLSSLEHPSSLRPQRSLR